MPAMSEAQRKFLYARKGPAWAKAHGFDNKGKLPEHVAKRAAKRHVKRHHSGY